MDRIDCERLEQYFNQIPGLLMIDMEGTIFYINDQCSQSTSGQEGRCALVKTSWTSFRRRR